MSRVPRQLYLLYRTATPRVSACRCAGQLSRCIISGATPWVPIVEVLPSYFSSGWLHGWRWCCWEPCVPGTTTAAKVLPSFSSGCGTGAFACFEAPCVACEAAKKKCCFFFVFRLLPPAPAPTSLAATLYSRKLPYAARVSVLSLSCAEASLSSLLSSFSAQSFMCISLFWELARSKTTIKSSSGESRARFRSFVLFFIFLDTFFLVFRSGRGKCMGTE